jgi:glutathione S-transferase
LRCSRTRFNDRPLESNEIDTLPVLYHDPTSEPSRAVHWFAVETAIPVDLRFTWLTRNEHRSPALLAVNPRHQVPALKHGDFHLSEATAIIRYLAESTGNSEAWLGQSLRERARINQLLSWYHTNLRQQSTLDYMLDVLLLPAYLGTALPTEGRIESMRQAARVTLERTQEFLGSSRFLGGERPMAPDLLFGSEIFALDCDPGRELLFAGLPLLQQWLERLRALESYELTHKAWHVIAPMILSRLTREDSAPNRNPRWVADTCERVLGIKPSDA